MARTNSKAVMLANRRTIVRFFRRNGVVTAADVAGEVNLSKPTVHRALAFLIRKKILMTVGKGESGGEGGKKPHLLSLNPTYRHIFCFQMFATHLISAVADLRGKVLAETTVSFRPNIPLDALLGHMRHALASICESLELEEKDLAGVVMGCHGVTDSETGVIASSPYFPSWGSDIPLTSRLAGLFRNPPPIHIDNYNRYDAYAEFRIGQARERNSFVVIDGEKEGLGAGLIVNGALWRGSHFLSGEIGHMMVDPSGWRQCSCGARGCLATMASMDSLEEEARLGHEKNRDSRLFLHRSPEEVTYRDIFNAANSDDAFARELVEKCARWLAAGIVNIMVVADPEIVILQGPYAEGGWYLLDRLRHFIHSFAMPRMNKNLEIACSSLGRDRGIVGSANYAADIFFESPELYQ